MAKITQIFKLNKTQHEIDFVDIDVRKDTPFFIDPYWISKQDCDFTVECDMLIKSFFTKLVSLIKADKMREAFLLCSHLSESSDICLGYSQKRGTNGSGIGPLTARKFCIALKNSKAFQKDLLVNIEDSKVFIDNLDVDRISDMVANIIRKPLLNYTIQQCNNYDIQLTPTQSNFYWDEATLNWERANNVPQLLVKGKKILLVPRKIVSDSNHYTWENFLQHYILEALKQQNLEENTSLVGTRKDGTMYVTKQSIKDSFESKKQKLDKAFCEQFAVDYPEVYNKFKQDIIGKYKEPNFVKNEKVSVAKKAKMLIKKLQETKPGKEDDTKYENIIFDILVFILGNNVSCPNKQVEFHDGRKRIDIVFLNSAKKGVLLDIINIYNIPMKLVICECKNYSKEISNPELDQLSGRFSPMKSKCGFILYRSIKNKAGLIKRCQDTYKDDRGLIIPLSDEDIINILQSIVEGRNDFDDIVKKLIFDIIKD